MNVQLSNRFNQARNRYIQAAMRRIDAETDPFQDEVLIRQLGEIEDREYEIMENI